MLNRRDFLATTLGLAPAARINSTFRGVTIGINSYAFRDRSLDRALAAVKELGIGSLELWSGHVEPVRMDRADMRKWRETVPLSHFEGIRKQLNDAGIEPGAFNYPFRSDFSDAEIQRGFDFAKALGAQRLTVETDLVTLKRIDPLAARARIPVACTDLSHLSPKDCAAALRGLSNYTGLCLDIGQATASGFDAVAYLSQTVGRLICLHLNDRKQGDGPHMPFGKGDTPIQAVLQLMARNQYKFPAFIEVKFGCNDPRVECAQTGKDDFTKTEAKDCFHFCKRLLS
jgi:sugar phosphate isomerase/epimerase